jgi:hypothetical protein
MFQDNSAPFAGTHYHLAAPINHPQPLSKPHPPILIGGMGENKTLRLVAQYGDACNFFIGVGDDVLRAKLDTLKAHCDSVGRDYHQIEKTALNTVNFGAGGTTPAAVIANYRHLADLGFQHIIVNIPNVHEIKPLEIFAKEIIPAVAGF